MARYKVCENCKRLVKYRPATTYEGGISYTVFICPECGFKKETNVNHIHYGEDGK